MSRHGSSRKGDAVRARRATPLLLLLLVASCSGSGQRVVEEVGPAPAEERERLDWALAIHGGAGVISKDEYEPVKQEYLDALTDALELGAALLEAGGTSLDAVEQVVRLLEDDPRFNAGKGAVFNHEGHNELDASIMSGETLRCGAVAAVRTVKNPISLARKVMEGSKHVLFVADGAERFAAETGVERVDHQYFWTEKRWKEWLQRQSQPQAPDPAPKGTVGVVALDRHGNLAAGTSTGGLADKAAGRVGDSAVIGAGTYADNRTCAVSGTGKGEEFIRFTVAYRIAALMEQRGMTVEDAAREVVMRVLQPGDGGVIALDGHGDVAMVFNTPGMFRGAADSGGRFEVAIWE